jgi:hypothetical protein
MIRRAIALLSLLAFSALPATAQSVRSLGDYRDWSAYSATEGTGPVCFALSKPKDVTPTPDGYTEAFLYLTHRPSEAVRNEINLVAGFTFAPDTPATLSISGTSYDLFTEGDAAWLLNPGQNDDLAGTIRAGTTLTIEGTTSMGIRVVETFCSTGSP